MITKAARAQKRIGRAIDSARSIAATPEARELARRTGGKWGTWTAADERRLSQEGAVVTPGGTFYLRGKGT